MAKTITDQEEEATYVEAEPEPEVEEEIVNSFDDLMAADDLGPVYVALPAPWKGGVKVRPLSMEELHRMKRDATRRVRDNKGRVVGAEIDQLAVDKLTVLWSLVEPRLNAGQVDALFTRNNKLARAILKEVGELNGLTEESAAEVQRAAEAEFPR